MKIGHTIDASGFLTVDVLSGSDIIPDVTVICPNGFYKPKWNGNAWVEGLMAQEIQDILNRPVVKTPEAVKQELVDINLSALEVRTQGMQLIDDFTLGSLMTTDDRTAGMQLIDDYSLELIFALQATVEALTARITTLEGGV